MQSQTARRDARSSSISALSRVALIGTLALLASWLIAGCSCDGTKRRNGLDSGTGRRVDSGTPFDPLDGSVSSRTDSGPRIDAGFADIDAEVSVRDLVQVDECTNNNAGISAADVTRLRAGGALGSARLLYPYAGTVFPRNMLSPELMWDGANGTVAMIHMHVQFYDYYGCVRIDNRGRVTIPQDAWNTAGDQTVGPTTPFTIELTLLDGSNVIGPISTNIVIAQATIKGSIFYNSYVSPDQTTRGNSGRVYRIPPGGSAVVFLGGGSQACTGCHSLSANGTRLSSSIVQPVEASTYPITPTTTANPTPVASYPEGAFAALYPDGSLILSTGARNGGPMIQGGLGSANADATLRVTDTGQVVPNTGIPSAALMPTFSPDGTLLAFNDFGMGNGRTLAIMDFDAASRTASNRRTIHTDTTHQVGWPFFLPDNRAVVFTRTSSPTHSGGGALVDPDARQQPAEIDSDLYIADIAAGRTIMLAKAMGYDQEGGTPYVPFGEQDLHRHYYPTVSPVAAGGYFWVFFDTIRNYGNQGRIRQLWGAAVTIASDEFSYEEDPSHPPFYVTGQVFGTGNHRAFTALDPCRGDGESCESGIDCCSGFCTNGVCDLPERCSMVDEACTTDADCCDSTTSCIPPGYCGVILF